MSETSLFFTFKKLVAIWLDPLSAIFGLLFICFVLKNVSVFFRKRLLKPVLFFCASALCLLSTPLISYHITKPLESGFSQFEFNEDQAGDYDYILVLGCGHVENDALTTLDKYNACSTKRVFQAVELSKKTGIPIAFSGGVLNSNAYSEAYFNLKLARKLGIPSESLLAIEHGRDTKSETIKIGQDLKGKSLVLVTNASHIKRSMVYLSRAGIDNVAVSPTDFETRRGEPSLSVWTSYVPNSRSASMSYKALYEYLGLLSQATLE